MLFNFAFSTCTYIIHFLIGAYAIRNEVYVIYNEQPSSNTEMYFKKLNKKMQRRLWYMFGFANFERFLVFNKYYVTLLALNYVIPPLVVSILHVCVCMCEYVCVHVCATKN